MADSINTMLDEIIDDLKYCLEQAIEYTNAMGDDITELEKIKVKYFGT